MSSASLGKAAERRVRQDLQTNGYTVRSSLMSRGAADLWASKPGQTLAIQVKRSWKSGGGVGPEAWNELCDLAAMFSALPVVAISAPRRPVVYWAITGRKDGSRKRQPCIPFLLDVVLAGSRDGTP